MGMSGAEISRRYRERHPERVKATKAAHRARNLDKIRAYDRESQVRSRAERRAWLDEYKLKAGCTDCGYNAHPRALDFDHIGTDKVGNVGLMIHDRIAWPIILAEIAKCEIVCANCHRIRTYEREQRARAMDVPKPPPVADGQEALFGIEETG
jgi:hypothetical protein